VSPNFQYLYILVVFAQILYSRWTPFFALSSWRTPGLSFSQFPVRTLQSNTAVDWTLPTAHVRVSPWSLQRSTTSRLVACRESWPCWHTEYGALLEGVLLSSFLSRSEFATIAHHEMNLCFSFYFIVLYGQSFPSRLSLWNVIPYSLSPPFGSKFHSRRMVASVQIESSTSEVNGRNSLGIKSSSMHVRTFQMSFGVRLLPCWYRDRVWWIVFFQSSRSLVSEHKFWPSFSRAFISLFPTSPTLATASSFRS